MIFSKQDLEALCETAKVAAVVAGKYIQSQFDKHYNKGIKDGANSLAAQVVTEVDIKAQTIILEHLKDSIREYDLGVLTEESSDDRSRLEKDYFWCIDPLDGTLPFTEGRAGYAVSIALIAKSGDPIVGVVYIPDLALCYTAVKRSGVWVNGEPVVRKKPINDKTLHIYVDSSFIITPHFDALTNKFSAWAKEHHYTGVEYYDGFGAVFNSISVMNSKSACYFKFPKKQNGGGSIWDFAATCFFFEELGLNVSNCAGNNLQLNNANSTFMNEEGVIYATDQILARFILDLSSHHSS
uniref:3'(2'),5'-bisphosphate nucleotidase CysQ family protein n=1 Tax=Fulvivirga sp. TaxID=1931237 RepID=UPI004049973E